MDNKIKNIENIRNKFKKGEILQAVELRKICTIIKQNEIEIKKLKKRIKNG